MRVDVKRVLKNYGILFAFILVCAILAWLSPVFLRWNNVLNVIRQSSIYGIMAVGMTFVILTGGIDLSVGSILAVAGALAAGMLKAGAALPWAVAPVVNGVMWRYMFHPSYGLFNALLYSMGVITEYRVWLNEAPVALTVAVLRITCRVLAQCLQELAPRHTLLV